MTQTALPSFKEQLQQTLKFFSFKPSLYINSPRVNDTNKFMLFIILALVETLVLDFELPAGSFATTMIDTLVASSALTTDFIRAES